MSHSAIHRTDASAFCRSLEPRYVMAGGVRTHYVACGEGPALVLIHGLGASFWTWWRNLPVLAQHFHVIAYDLKGWGNSAKPKGLYTPEACTLQLVGLLDRLGVEQAALVGHSMGARVALNTAITHPERVQALALISPSCYPQTAGRPVRFLVLPGVGEIYTRALFYGRPERLVRRGLRLYMHPEATIVDEEIYWNMQSGVGEQSKLARTYLRYGRHMQFHKPWAQAQRYAEIAAPTLIVNGTHDRFVPLAHITRLAEALPRAQVEVWPDTGHMPYAERPERFNQAVRSFVESLA